MGEKVAQAEEGWTWDPEFWRRWAEQRARTETQSHGPSWAPSRSTRAGAISTGCSDRLIELETGKRGGSGKETRR